MFVLTQFNSASLNQHIKNTYHFDPFSNGFVDILAAEQTPGNDKWFQGTADAVRQSEHHINHHDYKDVLILSGDQLYQMDFDRMLKDHKEKDADLTIATIPVIAEDATAFGIMKVDEHGMIDSFIEKPAMDVLENWKSPVDAKFKRKKQYYLASMGIYAFKKEVMHNLLGEYPDATDFGKEIIPMAIEKGMKVASYSYDGYWTDIGNIPSFFEANIDLTEGLPSFNLFDEDNKVFTRPRMLSPSKLFGTRLNKVLLAEGSISHASRITRSVVGIRSRIGKGTVLEDVIVMGADRYESLEEVLNNDGINIGIGEDCRLKNVIVDKDARIGDDVHIVGDTSLEDVEADGYCIRGGVVVVKKNAIIENGSRIGLQS